MKHINKIIGNRVDLILKQYYEAIPEKKWVPKFVYNIVLSGTTTVIGECEARIGNSDNLFYNGHIGYAINPEYRGNEYVGEAVKLLFEVFKANKLNKIYISNSPENISSRRVCEKLNLKFLGTYELPLDNSMRLEDGKTHINVFEANI